MKIRNEIIIDFPLNFYIEEDIKNLEETYTKAQLIKNKNSEEYQKLEEEFYEYTLDLEISVNGAWRSGCFSEEQGNLILWKYEPFNWGD